jgi:hypothetical protein
MLLSWNAERLTIATPRTTETSCSANTDHTSLLLWCSAFTSNKYTDAHPLCAMLSTPEASSAQAHPAAVTPCRLAAQPADNPGSLLFVSFRCRQLPARTSRRLEGAVGRRHASRQPPQLLEMTPKTLAPPRRRSGATPRRRTAPAPGPSTAAPPARPRSCPTRWRTPPRPAPR